MFSPNSFNFLQYTALAMTVRFLDGSYSDGGALLEGVKESLRPSFGSAGFGSVLSPKSLILVCMLSTAYMAHFNAPKVRAYDFDHRIFPQCVGVVLPSPSRSSTWNSRTTLFLDTIRSLEAHLEYRSCSWGSSLPLDLPLLDRPRRD